MSENKEREAFEAWLATSAQEIAGDEWSTKNIWLGGYRAAMKAGEHARHMVAGAAAGALTDEQLGRLRSALFSQVESELAERACAILAVQPAAPDDEAICEIGARALGMRPADFAAEMRALFYRKG